jgi:hypothetical protein
MNKQAQAAMPTSILPRQPRRHVVAIDHPMRVAAEGRS